MTTNIQLLRSSVAQKRPQPSSLLDGQPAVNTNVSEPGLFFKATDGTLFKVGPVAVTTSGNAPNSAAAGPTGNVTGEAWLDGRSAFAAPILKVYNGTAWVASSGFTVDNSNGNLSLAKTITARTLIVNGSGANSYVRLPNGPTTDETSISAAAGMIRFDTTTNTFRGYNGTAWADISGGVISGNLSVSGNGTISGNLQVNGNTTLGNDCTIDTLTINSVTSIACNATIGTDSANTLTVNSLSEFKAAARMTSQTPIRFYSGTLAGSNYVALRAPSTIAANVTWTLPGADGSNGQVLQTNGSGALSWVSFSTPAAAGSTGQIQFNTSNSLDASASLTFNGTTLSTTGLAITGTSTMRAIVPETDNTYDLGSSSLRWANVYTGDLHLANDRGDWTVIEEEEYLSLRNNKTGKVFKLVMEEV